MPKILEGEINTLLGEQSVSLPGGGTFITGQIDLAVHQGNLIKRPHCLGRFLCGAEFQKRLIRVGICRERKENCFAL